MRVFLYSLLILSPLPFASARPVWQWLIVAAVAVAMACFAAQQAFTRGRAYSLAGIPAKALAFWAIFILWGVVQSAPLGLSISHPDSEYPITPGSLSVNPEATRAASALLAALMMVFVIAYATHPRRRHVRQFLFTMMVTSGLYALYGFLEFSTGNDHILWFSKTAYRDYLTATFVNRNAYAAFAGMGLILSAAWLVAYFKPVIRLKKQASKRVNGRAQAAAMVAALGHRGWIGVLCFALQLTALLLTGSRAGLVSSLLGLVVALAVMRRPGIRRRRYPQHQPAKPREYRYRKSGLAIVTTGLLVAAITLSGDLVAARVDSLGSDARQRLAVYQLMGQAIADRPLTGFGIGSFEDAFKPYRSDDIPLFFDRGHSDWLELVMLAGWPAALLLIIAAVLILRRLILLLSKSADMRPLISASLGIAAQMALHSAVDFSLQMPANALWLVSILAVAMAAGKRAATHRSGSRAGGAVGQPVTPERRGNTDDLVEI